MRFVHIDIFLSYLDISLPYIDNSHPSDIIKSEDQTQHAL